MTPWSVPTHQWGQTPQLCRSSRRKRRRRCCPSPQTAGALFPWWLSSPHSSTVYILRSLKDKIEDVVSLYNTFTKWNVEESVSLRFPEAAMAGMQLGEAGASVWGQPRVVAVGSTDNIPGKPQKDEFPTAPRVWLALMCRQNHVLTRATVSTSLSSWLFLPHNCERSRSSRSLHKKNNNSGTSPASFGYLTVVWEWLPYLWT